jgi:hypothetical protein
MKNILALILRYFSFLLCGLLLCAAMYYLYLIDCTVVLTGFAHTLTISRPPFSAVLPILPIAATPLGILACFSLPLSLVRKERTRIGEGLCVLVCHAATWFVLLPACFQFAVTLEAPPSLPKRPLNAGYFRPAELGELLFYTNVNPDRGFVLNTLADDARRISSFDETVAGDETAEAVKIKDVSPFSDPLVAERLRPPFWLSALASLMTTFLQRLRAAYFAGSVPWLFAAAPCFPLSALVVTSHLSRRRFSNLCRVVLSFLLIIALNIAWAHFDLDTLFHPVTDSFAALLPVSAPRQNGAPFVTLAAVNLLLALVLYCRGFIGVFANRKGRQKNTTEAFS